MVISKRAFTFLVLLAAAGVGAVMYAALLATGIQGGASSAPASAPTSSAPVRVSLDASELEGICQPVVIDAHGEGAGATGAEVGDFATNSGTIDGSQFNDGGFGDIGQQWWQVTVAGPVTNVHVGGDNSSAVVTVTTPGTEGAGAGAGGAGSASSPEPPPSFKPPYWNQPTTPSPDAGSGAGTDTGTESEETPQEG